MYNLRNIRKIDGFYSEKNQRLRYQHEQKKISKKAKNSGKFKFIFNDINCLLIWALKRDGVSQGKLVITKAFKEYLLNKYSITKRFQSIPNFIEDHQLVKEIYCADDSSKSVQNFEIKFNNKRRVSFLNKDFKKTILTRSDSISIKVLNTKNYKRSHQVNQIVSRLQEILFN
jgi:hypothetical protein